MPPSVAPPDRDDDGEIDEDIDLPLAEEQVDDDEPALPEGEGDLLPPIADLDQEEPLDDADDSDLEASDELDPVDEHEGAADDREIDVGPLDDEVSFTDGEGGDDRGEGILKDQDDLDLDDGRSDDDGGAEGTSEAPEDEVDEAALPELDADDEGEEGDEELADALLAGSIEASIPWDEARWAPLEGAGAEVPCVAISIDGGTVAAAGEVLLLVDEGARAARRAAFGAGSSAVAITDGLLLAATARGQLLLSMGGDKEASVLAGFREGKGPIDLAATSGRAFVREGEALLCFSSPNKPLTHLRAQGVMSIAASGGVLIALTREESGPMIERLRGDDEGFGSTELRGSARRLVQRAWTRSRGVASFVTLVAAASGRCLALTDGVRVAVSRDGGQSFETTDLGPVLALAFAGDDERAPLLALSAPRAAAPASLIRVPFGGEPSRIAEVPGLTQGVAAMVWDASRDCVWIACAAGLIALGSARRH